MNKTDIIDMWSDIQEILLSDINLVLYHTDYEDYIVAKKKLLSEDYIKKLQVKLKNTESDIVDNQMVESFIKNTFIPMIKEKFSKLNESNYSDNAFTVQLELSALIQSLIERIQREQL